MNFFRTYGRAASLLVIGLAILFFDFFTKAYVYHVLAICDPYSGVKCLEIPLFYNFLGIDFSISLATNTGIAWGLFSNFQFVLLLIRIVAIICLCLYLFFSNTRSTEFPLVLIIAGALGNVVDYFLYGFVVDFLHFNLWGYHFPVFNVADGLITIGVVWLFLSALLSKKKVPEHVA